MSPHISMITLGVPDVAKATAFYERLGFAKSSASQEGQSHSSKQVPLCLAYSAGTHFKRTRQQAICGPAMAASPWR